MRKAGNPLVSEDDLLSTLTDFTSKENWDKFFTIRPAADSFEWYAEWSQLREPLLSILTTEVTDSLRILVPGCGSSRLSEHLYDAGIMFITNIDFSKVVISDMLRRNVRERPNMRWRVMDMTSMQFTDKSFDIVVDKGGLDALMEPELGFKLGEQYLSEVKRVLNHGGKFICLTLAESHVLGLLFPKFRFGWKISIHVIPQKPSSKLSLRTFMVVAEKENSASLHPIQLLFNQSSIDGKGNQAHGLNEALDSENQIREGHTTSDYSIMYSLEDLQLGAKGDLSTLTQGRRCQLTLGVEGVSRFFYKTVLLDAQQQMDPFTYHCGVFIVPKTRAHEWLFSSEEGQWMVVESSKAARLIMVLLDTGHTNATMDDIKKDLSLLVKTLAPGKENNGDKIPFMMASDGIKQRESVHQVTSSLTGSIVIEDVVYEDVSDSRLLPFNDILFRRLIFQRTESLVQSEAILMKDEPSHKLIGDAAQNKSTSSCKSKRKGSHKQNEEPTKLKVQHDYLASSYHTGIVAGFMLVSSYLESAASSATTVKAVVIGLGAGLLPMFLHGCMPFLCTEAVELDPVVLDVAKHYFGFAEDARLKVHVGDGVQFLEELVISATNGKESTKVDILVIDVDSADSSSGITCPAAAFIEESFLLTAKDVLSKEGLFVINLVSRSSAAKDMVISRMKKVFSHLFYLELEEDVNIVLFGVVSESFTEEARLPEAANELKKLLKLKDDQVMESIMEATKKMQCLM